ncbi:hypothetical protein KUTeg_002670 [Tegillarca granosa]|uniref:dolichyl-P-Man:Man5GlcNAc2-PP-dolichol alpha-1,3-mannosyltransferase n=1 Tax=Tegillarca granosa TaxID=220873 RepID=A0ABQ9FV11_TEGGR|nr:hypothetical protein KUTeg_002670 [Tegillarca granosa]
MDQSINTEIDWVAYMQEVEGVVNGTYDYTQLKAGFVYIYLALYYITGHGINIRLGQYIFAGLYILSLLVIFDIYRTVKRVPPYVLFFICCASYRIHSIYILRLFNDPVSMLFLYIAIDLFLNDQWMLGCLIYSFGVSIKMNLLLFSPAVLMLLMARHGTVDTVKHLTVCAVTQVLLGLPFLLVNPVGYIARSFNLGRQFFYKWTECVLVDLFIISSMYGISIVYIICCGVQIYPLSLELSWNTYPSTVFSSSALHICHLLMLLGLWYCPDYTPQKKTVVANILIKQKISSHFNQNQSLEPAKNFIHYFFLKMFNRQKF